MRAFLSTKAYLDFSKRLLGVSFLWFGVAAIIIRTLLWLVALAQTDLSIAYPINSTQYIIILVMARIILKERIDRHKLIGTLLVAAGVVIVALS